MDTNLEICVNSGETYSRCGMLSSLLTFNSTEDLATCLVCLVVVCILRILLPRANKHDTAPNTPRPLPFRPPSRRAETPGTSQPPLQRIQTPLSPIPVRPPMQRMETPISPVTSSDDWDGYHPRAGMPPLVPDAPNIMPTSPTFTSSSSNTLESSHTSYSSNDFVGVVPSLVHWAQDVFDGQHPTTRFAPAYQLYVIAHACL